MKQSTELINLPVIVGPTAVGKTAVAVRIAEMFSGEIVSADSRQVYRGIEIGSGAPSQEELERVPHHLVGMLDPSERLSAGEFALMAMDVIKDIQKRGKLPILAGGSGLYVRALVDGLSPIPPSNEDVRQEIMAEVSKRGMQEMISELAKIDPKYAEKIDNNKKRLVRAVEVWRTTGRTISDWHREPDYNSQYNPVMFGLARQRQELIDRIERRINIMIDAGWKGEVENLSEHFGGYDKIPVTVTEGLGYREIISFLKGDITLFGAKEQILISTRQFAKRQMTWFRADKRIKWLELSGDEAEDGWVSWLQEELQIIVNQDSF